MGMMLIMCVMCLDLIGLQRRLNKVYVKGCSVIPNTC